MLTADRLRELLNYDPETGVFTWRVRRSPTCLKGSVAGAINQVSGYRQIGFDGQDYTAHRLAWLYTKREWPLGEIDHKNRVRDDNRIDNLRDATHSNNSANRLKQSNNTSGLKGVSYHKAAKRWRATIRKEHLGLFDTREAAHAAYCHAAQAAFGEFARA